MKFLMMIKHAEGAPGLEHPQGLYEAMGKFVEESFKSGILKDTAGLKRTQTAIASRPRAASWPGPTAHLRNQRRSSAATPLSKRRRRRRRMRSPSSSWNCIARMCPISNASARSGRWKIFSIGEGLYAD